MEVLKIIHFNNRIYIYSRFLHNKNLDTTNSNIENW